MMEKRKLRGKEGQQGGGGGVAREGASEAPSPAAEVAAAATDPQALAKAASTPPSDSPPSSWTNPAVPLPSFASLTPSGFPVARIAFSTNLAKHWNPKGLDPPRGCAVVSGLVEVRGKRGRVLLDVQSAYDPLAGKYVAVHAAVRGVKAWEQRPKGGA
ncbi:hypothetical protein LTR53_016680 [Teratosphaeriaceae sp. CCFEE 6253]|nr:hypothetical protein LTR53_016680 [Teratosphaeriaceae sp. CCFEE 6253]